MDKVIVVDSTVPPLSPPLRLLYRIYSYLTATELRGTLFTFALVLTVGGVVGAVVPSASSDPAPYDRISSIVGYIYFVAWSVSFYPQVILNWHRQSVVGMSFDYVLLNLLGFSCYTAYNTAYLWNPYIRNAYAAANGGNLPSVKPEDAFFAIHAVALTAVVCVQIALYERGGQRVSPLALAALACLLVAIVVYLVCTLLHVTSNTTWLNFLLFLSYVKLSITLMKYFPQAVLNCRRRSTVGWTIFNVLLDFTGGLLSIAQMLLDGSVTSDWNGVIGNPVKFGLGFTSMVFDIVFMVQHYCLYADAGKLGEYAALDAAGADDERYLSVLSKLASPDAHGARMPAAHTHAFQIDALSSPINTGLGGSGGGGGVGANSAGRHGAQPFMGDNLEEAAPPRGR